MKVHINKDGSFDLDVQEGETSIAGKMIHELTTANQNGVVEMPSPAALNQLQYEAWTWLVDNDTELGIHFTAMARGLDITEKAASSRCVWLTDKGFAYRTQRGRYRAKDEGAK